MTTPTPAPAPMTARLRELEASAAELANKLADAAARWRTKEFDDLCHANTGVIIEALRNAPTILRLLEAVEGAEKALTDIKEWKLPPSNCYWDKDRTDPMSYETAFGSNGARNHIRGVATSALATLRAAREGAR